MTTNELPLREYTKEQPAARGDPARGPLLSDGRHDEHEAAVWRWRDFQGHTRGGGNWRCAAVPANAQWLARSEGATAGEAAREYVGSWSSSGEAMDVTRATAGGGDAVSPPRGESVKYLLDRISHFGVASTISCATLPYGLE